MPTYYRRDDYVQMAIGYAVPNTAVTYFTQPSLTLANVYTGPAGGATTNPQYSDGFGHTIAYVLPGIYTITYSGPQIQTLILPDQSIGGAGGGSGNTVTPFAGIPQGTIDGVNRVFTLTNAGTPLTSAPSQFDVWLNFPLINGVGYTISGVIITYAVAPNPASGGVAADTIYAQGYTLS